MDLLRGQGMEDVLVVLGGIIPEQDRDPLEKLGVAAVFGPGTLTHQIVDFIESELRSGAETG